MDFLLFFLALCPFSPARLRISLWLPDVFGLFYCFSRLYVHFHRLSSVFLSGFRMFLDFFTVFLGLMSILTGSAPYFPLASGCFWTFLLLFSTLCPFSPARFRISLWLPDVFGLFPAFSVLYVYFLLPGSVFPSGFRMFLDFFTAFSVLYVHFLLPGSVFPSSFRMILDFFTLFLSFISIWKSIEVSRLRRARKSPTCVEFRNLQTTKSSESSELRKAVLIRIKRSAIICPAREIHMSE